LLGYTALVASNTIAGQAKGAALMANTRWMVILDSDQPDVVMYPGVVFNLEETQVEIPDEAYRGKNFDRFIVESDDPLVERGKYFDEMIEHKFNADPQVVWFQEMPE
jgi:hypothetical protein